MSTPLAVLTVLAVTALCGCTTPAQQKAAENEDLNKEAAAEILRICSLPAAERDAELAKVAKEDGMVIYCGSEQSPR
jgi:hypothetical protein